MGTNPIAPDDVRRHLVGVIGILLLGVSAALTYGMEDAGSAKFAAAAAGRIGLVMGALWLAWPSLRRPASWLPPGFAALCLVALAAVAARPRLVLVVVPALALLLTLATLARAMKR